MQLSGINLDSTLETQYATRPAETLGGQTEEENLAGSGRPTPGAFCLDHTTTIPCSRLELQAHMASTGMESGGRPLKFSPMLQDDCHAVRALDTRHRAWYVLRYGDKVWDAEPLPEARGVTREGPRFPNRVSLHPLYLDKSSR